MLESPGGYPAGSTGTGYVSVAFANVYTEPRYESEICSQAVLWERLSVHGHRSGFARVTCEDGYEGWIDDHQLVVTERGPQDRRMVTARHLTISEDSAGSTGPIGHVWAGGYVEVVSDNEARLRIELPDRTRGLIDAQGLSKAFTSQRRSIVGLARTYLGIPYFWGGKTPAGLDCSGFVQLLHKLCGIRIPRDSCDQHEHARRRSEDALAAQMGDLLFFSARGSRITHVGMSLGEGMVIHCRGMVRIESLDPSQASYRKPLTETFVAVGTYLDE